MNIIEPTNLEAHEKRVASALQVLRAALDTHRVACTDLQGAAYALDPGGDLWERARYAAERGPRHALAGRGRNALVGCRDILANAQGVKQNANDAWR